jgi:hypothetical protein
VVDIGCRPRTNFVNEAYKMEVYAIVVHCDPAARPLENGSCPWSMSAMITCWPASFAISYIKSSSEICKLKESVGEFELLQLPWILQRNSFRSTGYG